jgi:hypothetical protein
VSAVHLLSGLAQERQFRRGALWEEMWENHKVI